VIIVKFAPQLKPVLKHETHDQSSHGSWATRKGSINTSISTSTNAIGQEIQKITYGDIIIERNKPGEIRDSSDQTRFMWTFTAGSDAMRTVSSQIMGIPNPSTALQLDEYTKITLLEGKESINPTPSATENNFISGNYARNYISGAYTLMGDVQTSEPLSVPLYRGISVPKDSSLLNVKIGESFTLPLSSTTNSQNVAERYSWRFGSERSARESIVFKFENVKATAIRHQASSSNNLVSEYVTQGKYKVKSINQGTDVKGDNYMLVTLSQTDVFNIDKGGYESIKP
jgi:hypothetical protein